jgi:glutamate-ammonia-ligase adenylyltransferase
MLRQTTADCRLMLSPGAAEQAQAWLADLGFAQPAGALARLQRLSRSPAEQDALVETLPALLGGLQAAHAPDQSLLNLERLVDATPDRQSLFERLAESPRQVEILLRLFVSSQFLSEILLRNPDYLARLTRHQRLAEIKLPTQFAAEATTAASGTDEITGQLNALRRYQQWELLRLAACDTFHLMDLKTVTRQLSWLAEAMVQACLQIVTGGSGTTAGQLSVIAFGKLGAEELNYSSDIDLVFLVERDAEKHWKLAQRLIAAIHNPTEFGFLYRVDMRLRPWGRSGPLVTTAATYVDYLRRHARSWELQALLKARTIAGNIGLGERTLHRAEAMIFELPAESTRAAIRGQLDALRPAGASAGQLAAEVKTGPGGIRDIEFLTQYLQIVSGHAVPQVRSRSTLDTLVRLADAERILPGEYRHLSSAYLFQRSVEHALQLLHNQQRSRLPTSPRELDYLAGRLDFSTAEQFLRHFHDHRRYVQDIVTRRLADAGPTDLSPSPSVSRHLGGAVREFSQDFGPAEQVRAVELLEQIGPQRIVATGVRPLGEDRWELLVAGFDQLGDLSLIAGRLFADGYDIESGFVFTGDDLPSSPASAGPGTSERRRKFINLFTVRRSDPHTPVVGWESYENSLRELLALAAEGQLSAAQGRLARQVELAVARVPRRTTRLAALEIAIENSPSERETRLLIRGEDTPGFLYELCNALATSDVSIQRMRIETTGSQVTDTLYVTASDGRKITDPRRLQELRAAIVLTKQFTHLLPGTANPAAALAHFRELLIDLFRQPGWLEELGSLQQPEVLSALVKLFGESDFLWEDFLRLHHEELLPLLSSAADLDESRDVDRLLGLLRPQLQTATAPQARRRLLNEFKDREMFRIDMRHILGRQRKFGAFSQELTWLAEAVIQCGVELSIEELRGRYGRPLRADGRPSRFSVCALGKCGGRELGFASDIELMFLFDEPGQTDGPQSITNSDYYFRLAETFTKLIESRQQGIFEIDLRLRPYGAAGALAFAVGEFARYYHPDGPSWPYERQALVKLRPVAGDPDLGREIIALRDAIVYSGRPFDLIAMRGLRERQLRELVCAGEFNAKLSPGGVVDCEYFVQALQVAYGHLHPELREPNTREALRALEQCGLIADRRPLRDAYRFLRRLIDALRMVRGNARDLAVPPAESDQFEFLARRLGYGPNIAALQQDLSTHTAVVLQHMQRLESLLPAGTAG